MTVPQYQSRQELELGGDLVIPLEPVSADAPNRGSVALANGMDYVTILQRAHQSLYFGTAPRMLWENSTGKLTIENDLVLKYVLDDFSGTLPVSRYVTLKPTTWDFGASQLMVIPLGIDSSATLWPTSGGGGTVDPPSEGQIKLFATEAEAQQFFKAEASRQTALKYIVFARRAGSSLQLFNGLVLRDGAAVEDFRDEEYAGDATTAATRALLNQDRSLHIHGGGAVSMNHVGTNFVVTALSNVFVTLPGGAVTEVTGLTGAGKKLHVGAPVLAVELNRTPGSTVTANAQPVSWASLAASKDNLVGLAYLDYNTTTPAISIVRWREGSGYTSTMSYPLGMPYALSAAFLIGLFTSGQVFPTDVDADLGVPALTPDGSSPNEQVAFVVDKAIYPGAPSRSRIRLVTRDSLDDSVTPENEVLRMYGAEVEVLHATGNFGPPATPAIHVMQQDEATTAAIVAQFAAVEHIRGLSAGVTEIKFRDDLSTGYINVRADAVIAEDALVGSTIRPDIGGGTDVFFRDEAGFDNAEVYTNVLDVKDIRRDSGTLNIYDPSRINGFANVQAGNLYLLDNLRLSLGHIEVPSELKIRDLADTNYLPLLASGVQTHDLFLFETQALSVLTAQVSAADHPIEGTRRQVTLAGSGTSPNAVAAAQSAEVTHLRTLEDTLDYITVVDSGNTGAFHDLGMKRSWADEVFFEKDPSLASAPAKLYWSALGDGAVVVSEGSKVSLASERIRANAYDLGTGTGTLVRVAQWNDGSDDHVKIVADDDTELRHLNAMHLIIGDEDFADGRTAARLRGRVAGGGWTGSELFVTRADNTDYGIMTASEFRGRNVPAAIGYCYDYSGSGTWTASWSFGRISSVTEQGVDTIRVTVQFNPISTKPVAIATPRYNIGGTYYPLVAVLTHVDAVSNYYEFQFYAASTNPDMAVGVLVTTPVFLRKVEFGIAIMSSGSPRSGV